MSRYVCTLRTAPVTGASWPFISERAPSTCSCAMIRLDSKSEIRKPGPLGKPSFNLRIQIKKGTKSYRPWQSWAVPPHVEELKSHDCPFQGLPGLSQKAPRLQKLGRASHAIQDR